MNRGRFVSVLLVFVMVLAACAASDSMETFMDISSSLDGGGDGAPAVTTAATSRDSGESGEVEGAATDTDTADEDKTVFGDGATTPVVFQASPPGRDIIFTADIRVAVPDVGAASAEAGRVVALAGGFLFGQETTGGLESVSILTFKVDPDRFHEVLNDLSSIGEVRTQNVTATDVTDRVVDLRSQIATSAASVERLRALLAEATDIKEVVALEAELVARETQLESLRGRLRTLEDQVALATIVMTITRDASNPEIDLVVTALSSVGDSGPGCPGEYEALHIEIGDRVTLCYEVTNIGDTLLRDFELRDPVLDQEIGDMTLVYGDLDEPLEPGASLMLATEVLVERDLRIQSTITAQPVNDDGTAIDGAPATRTSIFFLEAFDPGGIPTFVDGLQTSWEWLLGLGQIVLLLAGALLPFIWVPAGLYFLWRLVVRSRNRTAEDS